jgi:hypothetical protein
MTPRVRAHLQEAILDAIKAAHPGTRDVEIADAAGVCRPHVSRLRSGERELDLSGIVGLIRVYGGDVVLGPIAALDGCRVVSRETPEPRASLGDLALEIGSQVGAVLGELREATRDGRVTASEADQVRAAVAALRALQDELGAALDRAVGGGP